MKSKLLLIVIVICSYACTFDDSEDIIAEETNAASIIGTWDLTSFRFSEAVDFNLDEEASEEFLDEIPCFNTILIFDENGTFNSEAVDIEFTVDMTGTSFDCLETNTITTGTWTIEAGNLITVTDAGTTETMITIDDDILQLSGGLFGVGEIEIDDSIMATLTFDRQ